MPNEAPPLRFDDPAIVRAKPEEIVVAVALLARQVADLHRQDSWCGTIGQENITIHHSNGELRLELRRDTSERLVVGRAPPEATGASGKEFSPILSIAQVELQKLKQACTPERIDSYQIACLAIELLTQANVQQYLSDLAVAARVPRSLRNVLDLALCWGGADGTSTPLALAASLENWLQEPKPSIDGNTPSNYIPPSPTKRLEIKGKSAASQPKVPLPFEQLGPYRIIDRIGSGGMGDVFRGREEGLNRDVAIKVLPRQLASQNDFVARFRTEAAAIAKAAHPNIVPIYSIGFDQGCHYFAMQYVEGDTLGTLLAREKRLSPLRAADLTLQILSGLGWVHRQGLVHRDLKPSNILLDHTTQRAMVADFGLVKSVEESNALTVSGVVMGTVDYISPEQARGGAIDARADLYSVGVLLYQMLAGRLPFEGDSATSMLFQHIYEPPPRLETIAPEAPMAIADIVHRLMEKKPADRLANCEETTRVLRDAVDQVVSGISADRSGKRHTTICKAPRWADEPIAGAPAVNTSPSEASPNEASTTSRENLGWRWFRGRVAKVAGLKAQTVDQTTCLQVDDAILEYQRRKISLQRLLSEAKSIERQLKEHPPDSEATANEVQDHVALLKEQQEQIETMELAFAKASANLTKLTAQRDALRARLRMAEASIEAASPSARSSLAITAWIGLGLCGFTLLLAICFWQYLSWFSSKPEPKRPVVAKPATLSSDRFTATFSSAPTAQFFNRGSGTDPYSELYFATHAGQVARLQIFDVGFSEPVTLLDIASEGKITALAASSDGTVVVTAHPDKVTVWGIQEKRAIQRFDSIPNVKSVRLSPNKKKLAVGVEGGALRVLDIVSGREDKRIAKGDGRAIQWTMDGNDISVIAFGDLVRRFNGNSNTVLQNAEGMTSHMEFAAGGRLLGLVREQIYEWDTSSGERTANLGREIVSAGYFASGSHMLALDRHGKLELWNVEARSDLKTIARIGTDHVGLSALVAHCEAGNLALVVRGLEARVYVLPEIRQTFVSRRVTLPEPAQQLFRSPFDSDLWIVGRDKLRATRVPLPPNRKFHPSVYESASPPSAVTHLPFTPQTDPQRLLVGKLAAPTVDGLIELFVTDQQKDIADRTFRGHKGSVSSLISLRSGERFLSAGFDGTVRTWETASEAQLEILQAGFSISSMVCSSDGERIAIGGEGGKLEIWNRATSARLHSLSAHKQAIIGLAMAADASLFVSASDEKQFALWSFEQEAPKGLLDSPSPIHCVAITPDARFIAGGGEDGVVRIWRANSNVADFALRLHQGRVNAVLIAPDGQSGYSAGADGVLNAWVLPQGP